MNSLPPLTPRFTAAIEDHATSSRDSSMGRCTPPPPYSDVCLLEDSCYYTPVVAQRERRFPSSTPSHPTVDRNFNGLSPVVPNLDFPRKALENAVDTPPLEPHNTGFMAIPERIKPTGSEGSVIIGCQTDVPVPTTSDIGCQADLVPFTPFSVAVLQPGETSLSSLSVELCPVCDTTLSDGCRCTRDCPPHNDADLTASEAPVPTTASVGCQPDAHDP